MHDSPPIFIVGPSRSGTSMLRGSLNNHPGVWITRETHFFDDLRPRLPIGVPLSGLGVRRCEDYLLRIGHKAYGLEGDPEQSRIPRAALRARAQEYGGSSDAYFEAFCRLTAEARGRSRWGEKTPRHVFRIDELASTFPTAKVVCLVRDPRAVVASYRDWKRRAGRGQEANPRDRRRAQRSYDTLLHALLWKSTMRAAQLAVEKHGAGRVTLIVYEDLVAAPDDRLRELAEWLELDFHAAMLDVPILLSSYAETETGDRKISAAPAERWREKLDESEIALIQSVNRAVMTDLGYAPIPQRLAWLKLAWAWTKVPLVLARVLVANRSRLGRVTQYVGRRAALAFGRRPA